jgi:subtilisin family serine protease
VSGEVRDTGEVLIEFDGAEGPGAFVRTIGGHLDLFATFSEAHYNPRLGLWRVRLYGDQPANELASVLRSVPGVVHAAPNRIYRHAASPDDPLYGESQLPYLAAINAPSAWDMETGDASVVVAVIDGGVDIDHPELDSRIWTNSGEVVDQVDNDNNGCIDDVHGCSFQVATPNGNVGDLDGHGTFISGIIAAETNNGEGVAGVAWNATVMPVRALDATGEGTAEQLADSIRYAAVQGARILNLSLAFEPVAGQCEPPPEEKDPVEAALTEARNQGALIIAAAGNFTLDCVTYPGSSSSAFTVGASGPPSRPDIRAHFSNWGPEVAVAAPGVNLVSACPIPTAAPTNFCRGDSYGRGSGTSFSTPIVAGAAALLIAQDPQISNDALIARLKGTAQNMPDEDHTNWDGAGRIDIAAALGAGTGYSVVDLSGPETTEVDLRVEVGEGASPACRSRVWAGPLVITETVERAFSRPGIHGSFGSGECAQFWPPSAARPWYLAIASGGPKSIMLNTLSFRLGAVTCAAVGAAAVPPGELRVPVTCDAGLMGNDERSAATGIDASHLPARFEQELRHATKAPDDPVLPCTPPPTPINPDYTRSVWYRIDPVGEPVAVAVDTFESEIDAEIATLKTVLAAFRSTAGGLEVVACNVLYRSPLADTESRIVFKTDSASVYYVLAGAFQDVPMGRLRLNVNEALLPPNDEEEGAVGVSLADTYTHVQPAHSATKDGEDPAFSCAPAYGYSVWFRVQEPGPQMLRLTTAGSDYDTVAAVFRRDTEGALTEIACNNHTPGTFNATVDWQSDGGEYFVVVAAFGGSGGSVLRADLQTP